MSAISGTNSVLEFRARSFAVLVAKIDEIMLAACPSRSVLGYNCKQSAIPCVAASPCETVACDKVRGCVRTPVACPAPDKCTSATCTPTSDKDYKCVPTPSVTCTAPAD